MPTLGLMPQTDHEGPGKVSIPHPRLALSYHIGRASFPGQPGGTVTAFQI